MSDVQFPSGQWVGFYNYENGGRRYLMDLILEFRDGRISGEGADGIGFFGIEGRYYPKEAECLWTKTYFGMHSVEYSGFREKKGIWGLWTIDRTKGGFHIWPIGEGLSLESMTEAEEGELPLRPVHETPAATASCGDVGTGAMRSRLALAASTMQGLKV